MLLRILNWLTIALGCGGIYVAGILAASHFFDVEVPCGTSSSCAVVQNHPSSTWFNIPVAYFGLAAYVAIVVLAIIRTVGPVPIRPKVSKFLFGGTILGAIVSIVLQYIAFVEIRATCQWCMYSAAIMGLLFIVNAGYSQAAFSAAPHQDDPDTIEAPDKKPRNAGLDFGLIAVVVIGSLVMAGLKANEVSAGIPRQRIDASKLGEDPKAILLEDGHRAGSPEAPIVVIEFADLYCPACRSSFVKMKRIVEQSNGKVAWIFRHFPLFQKQGHENAVIAATMAEIAAEKGKFYEFLEAVLEADPKDVDTEEKLYGLLENLGVPPEKAQEILGNAESKEYLRVHSDLSLGNLLGLRLTPTFIVLAGDDEPVAVTGEQLERMLNEPKYRKLQGK